ncbi:MAG: hypothetical protein VX643_03300 [Chloroflexota bacterium]|nr:hypothetical protein [Chloroflexota bacterium]
MPLPLFIVGGAATVVFSFVLIGFLIRENHRIFTYPRFNLLLVPPIRILFSSACLGTLKIASVLIFILIILTGLFGNQRPVDNLTPTLVWVIWWVGLGFIVSSLGNVWSFLNPWKIIFSWWESSYNLFANSDKYSLAVRYPKQFGIWPAVALFLGFAWLESAFVDSVVPRILANFIIAYSLITWTGMAIFGKHQWLRYGEIFNIVFGFMTKLSITEVRVLDSQVCRDHCSGNCGTENVGCIDCYECFEYSKVREFNLRPPVVGVTITYCTIPGVVAMVMLLLATVSFDGLSATPEWVAIQTYFILNFPGLTYQFLNGALIANSLGLLIAPLLFAGIFGLFLKLMYHSVGSRGPNVSGLMAAFAFSLLPISIAYNYAHFISLLMIQGQQLIPLISDPLGVDWDLFGTATYQVNFGIIRPQLLWIFAILIIIIGHISAVYLSHIKALELYRNSSIALKSQFPMLVLMVFYTMVSLWIVSRPITE